MASESHPLLGGARHHVQLQSTASPGSSHSPSSGSLLSPSDAANASGESPPPIGGQRRRPRSRDAYQRSSSLAYLYAQQHQGSISQLGEGKSHEHRGGKHDAGSSEDAEAPALSLRPGGGSAGSGGGAFWSAPGSALVEGFASVAPARAAVFLAPVRALVALLFAVFYVLTTYVAVGGFPTLGEKVAPLWVFVGDTACAAFVLIMDLVWIRFLCAGVPGWSVADCLEFSWADRFASVLSWGALVELVCVIAVLPAFFVPAHSAWIDPAGAWRTLFCARFLLVYIRLSHLLDIRFERVDISLVRRQVIRTYLVIATTLLTTTSVLQVSILCSSREHCVLLTHLSYAFPPSPPIP
jgi:hypothetical protein